MSKIPISLMFRWLEAIKPANLFAPFPPVPKPKKNNQARLINQIVDDRPGFKQQQLDTKRSAKRSAKNPMHRDPKDGK